MRLSSKTIAVVGGSAQTGNVTPEAAALLGAAAEPWGRAAAKRLALDGAEVLVMDPNEAWVRQTCDEIIAQGGRCQGVSLDIADFAALDAWARERSEQRGALDALVTCYLDIDWNSIEHADIDAFERVLLFNLAGPVKATKAFLPLLKRAEGASIVHIGSVDGIFGAPAVPSYSTSKGGLGPLTHIMAYEFARYDIRVNTVASCQTIELPAELMDTAAKAYRGLPGGAYMKQLNDATPLKRKGPLTDWAGAISFLVSADASFVTGSVLVVDCGRTIITPGTQRSYT
jgi:NAD(P)-dependent dehydrogenase (short-subunit alcohol dehydrogenase family)